MKEGMRVEYYTNANEWESAVDDSCNFNHFYYRIVPPPKITHKPYTFDDCCSLGFLGKAVKRNLTGQLGYVDDFDGKKIWIRFYEMKVDYSYEGFIANFTWIDSSPCGMEL